MNDRVDLNLVLEEINKIRTARELKPLKKIPKGIRCNPHCCPLAKALDAVVRVSIYYFSDDLANQQYLPEILRQFRLQFDNGWFPELN